MTDTTPPDAPTGDRVELIGIDVE
ncbi:MAG: hypothetical protein JWM93_3314, partial [Frankiales bacterium]|nr:hypothetical protein [Frankiales bacterium]